MNANDRTVTVSELDRLFTESYPKLLALAAKKTRSKDRAAELLSEAYVSLRERRRTWNREKTPSFVDHVLNIVGSLSTHKARDEDAEPEMVRDEFVFDLFDPVGLDPERLLSAREEHERYLDLVERLRASLPEGSLRQRLLVLAVEEQLSEPSEQARRLGVPYAAVIEARRWFTDELERRMAKRGRRRRLWTKRSREVVAEERSVADDRAPGEGVPKTAAG